MNWETWNEEGYFDGTMTININGDDGWVGVNDNHVLMDADDNWQYSSYLIIENHPYWYPGGMEPV